VWRGKKKRNILVAAAALIRFVSISVFSFRPPLESISPLQKRKGAPVADKFSLSSTEDNVSAHACPSPCHQIQIAGDRCGQIMPMHMHHLTRQSRQIAKFRVDQKFETLVVGMFGVALPSTTSNLRCI
jgi:hypothetical protein